MNMQNYTSKTINLPSDYEGEVTATLVSSNSNVGNRKSVLYIHGYIDYFFHPHVGEQFNNNNFDFYAIDLRKYGRSLLEHQHPNYCKSIEEYFEEISIAIREIKSKSTSVYLLGHSTGGLIASAYMNDGEEKSQISGLILNSPFFDFNESKIVKAVGPFFAKVISSISTYANMKRALTSAYPESIHKSFHGEWDFNLDWKPIEKFPTYFKWIAAISNAQRKLAHSNITVPILILHSSSSKKLPAFSEEALSNDVVLDIEDMKRVGSKLGNQVTFSSINNALHDIFLSRKSVREDAFEKLFSWLQQLK